MVFVMYDRQKDRCFRVLIGVRRLTAGGRPSRRHPRPAAMRERLNHRITPVFANNRFSRSKIGAGAVFIERHVVENDVGHRSRYTVHIPSRWKGHAVVEARDMDPIIADAFIGAAFEGDAADYAVFDILIVFEFVAQESNFSTFSLISN